MPSCLLKVKVTPRSSRNELRLEPDGSQKAWVTAPPTDGQANRAVCELVAKALGVPKSAVTVERGESSRTKILRIEGLDPTDLERRLKG